VTAAAARPRRHLDPAMSVVWAGNRFALKRSDGSVAHDLSPAQALAVLLLAETGSEEAVKLHAAHLHPTVGTALDQVVARFPTYLRGDERRTIDYRWWGEHLPRATAPPRREEAAPASITWLLTLECNRRCPYCFYRILPVSGEQRGWPRDSLLRGDRALEIIREMARIGTADLYLTGGEPMLRPDIVELVREAATAGIRVHIVTKFAIDRTTAGALAEAGLYRITVSLDDLRPDVARRLTGAANYPA
jgi:sulfatase maturation enzyme AslB (radical SAM superfamily)